MQAAFYKGRREGLAWFYNRLVRLFEGGPYAHCELIFSDGISASASWMDGGVRFKQIRFSPNNWDIIELPGSDEDTARAWFARHDGQKYDMLGNLKFLLKIIPHSRDKWFCSEALAAALGMDDPWSYGPNSLYQILK